MSQVETGLEEPEHFLGHNLDNMLDHRPGNPTRPRGGGGGDRGECSLDLLKSEGSRWEGYGPGREWSVRSWGPRRGLREEGSCKQLCPVLGGACQAIGAPQGGDWGRARP